MIVVLQTKKPFKHDGKEGTVFVLDTAMIRILNDDKGEPTSLTGVLASGESFKFPKEFVENWPIIMRNLGGTAKKFGVNLRGVESEDFGII